MVRVHFTPHLARFFPDLGPLELEAGTVAELVRALDALHPGLAGYLVEDDGGLRKHVSIYVDEDPVRDRAGLGDALRPGAQVHVLQALSGG